MSYIIPPASVGAALTLPRAELSLPLRVLLPGPLFR